MNTEKIMEDIQSVQDNIREIKSTWGNTIMTLDNIKSGLKADVQKKTMESFQRGYDDGYEAGCATAFKPVSDAEYQRGYDEGYKKCLSENDFDQPCVSCEDYQRGMDDAMSAFKKLYSCGWERDWKAMGFEFDEGEWSTSFEFIIGHYTAAEIVEKVKAYEESKNKIRVGDVVYFNGKPEIKACVTSINESGMETTFCGIAITNVETYCSVGNPYSFCRTDDWCKTGEHFDIEQLWKGES